MRRSDLIALWTFATLLAVHPITAAAAGPQPLPACGPESGTLKLDYVAPQRLAPARLETVRAPAAFGGGGGVTFQVEYLDVTNSTGVGFDDPTLGATRRSTAAAVLSYMASVLPHDGSALIEFQESQTDGTGFLGAAQPLGPAIIGCVVAFPVIHITTGIDPDPSMPDGVATIDFGWPYNDDTGPVGAGEFDLFTLLLHELTHAIGFVSTLSIDDSGIGPIGLNPDIRVLGFDDYLEGPMVSCPDGTFIGVGGPTGDLVNPLGFRGPGSVGAWQGLGETGLPPLYMPDPHEPGSSVTHWDFIPALSGAVMIPFISPETEKRTWSSLELGALDDIGYSPTIDLGACPSGPVIPDAGNPGTGFFPNVKTSPLHASDSVSVPWCLHTPETVTNVAGILFVAYYDVNELDLRHTAGAPPFDSNTTPVASAMMTAPFVPLSSTLTSVATGTRAHIAWASPSAATMSGQAITASASHTLATFWLQARNTSLTNSDVDFFVRAALIYHATTFQTGAFSIWNATAQFFTPVDSIFTSEFYVPLDTFSFYQPFLGTAAQLGLEHATATPTPTPTPEPGVLVQLVAGGAVLLAMGRKRNRP